MDAHRHHEGLVAGLYRQLKDIFESSEPAVYLYLDDIHKACDKLNLLSYYSQWCTKATPSLCTSCPDPTDSGHRR